MLPNIFSEKQHHRGTLKKLVMGLSNLFPRPEDVDGRFHKRQIGSRCLLPLQMEVFILTFKNIFQAIVSETNFDISICRVLIAEGAHWDFG